VLLLPCRRKFSSTAKPAILQLLLGPYCNVVSIRKVRWGLASVCAAGRQALSDLAPRPCVCSQRVLSTGCPPLLMQDQSIKLKDEYQRFRNRSGMASPLSGHEPCAPKSWPGAG
jgi:hypothetical protein